LSSLADSELGTAQPQLVSLISCFYPEILLPLNYLDVPQAASFYEFPKHLLLDCLISFDEDSNKIFSPSL
jgi:hypothetical protein